MFVWSTVFAEHDVFVTMSRDDGNRARGTLVQFSHNYELTGSGLVSPAQQWKGDNQWCPIFYSTVFAVSARHAVYTCVGPQTASLICAHAEPHNLVGCCICTLMCRHVLDSSDWLF